MISTYTQSCEITHDFIPTILAVHTRFHRSWDWGMYTDVVQSASLSFHLIFCLPFLKQHISHSNLAIHSWFWCISDRVKSLMISSIPFSLIKHIFIGNEIEVCAPMWFNRLLSPSISISIMHIFCFPEIFGGCYHLRQGYVCNLMKKLHTISHQFMFSNAPSLYLCYSYLFSSL